MSKQSYHLRLFGLLSILPPELRNIMYGFALVDPPKWERPHKRCPHRPNNGYLAHICRLPFKQSCRGRVREGVSLLQVNKALHTEASPIFWSQNIFCFLSGDEFIKCVSTYLRSDYRSFLRHIRILGCIHPRAENSCSFTTKWWERDPGYEKKPFEVTIRQCTGLRTLGIDIDSVTSWRLGPDYLNTSYVQILGGMISPKVQFSFLKLDTMPALDMAEKPIKRSIWYRSLSQMPYDLHDEAVTSVEATTEGHLPMRDWEPVYEPLRMSLYLITRS